MEGSKRFRLVDPSDNTRMYEGHMREAELEAFPVNTHQSKKTKFGSAAKESFWTEHHVESLEGAQRMQYHFLKRKLTESTSMVHSPVDINELHWDSLKKAQSPTRGSEKKHNDNYPKSKGVLTMDCKVDKGDALWVPSYWWHEVQSYPSLNTESGKDRCTNSSISCRDTFPLNVAVNFWFEPLYKKEFPCASCTKHLLNQKYAKVLQHMLSMHLLS